MTYTSHGLMTPADMAEYRQDYDGDELNPPEPEDDDGPTTGAGMVSAR
jgi:hypothetical protein